MKKSRTSTAHARSHEETGEFWDTHDLSDSWDQTRPVEMEFKLESEAVYYALDQVLAEKVRAMARKRGVPANTLVNLWVQEKLQEQAPAKVRGARHK